MSLNSISNYQQKEQRSELTTYPTTEINKDFAPFAAVTKNSSKNLDLHDFSIYRWPDNAKYSIYSKESNFNFLYANLSITRSLL